MTGNGYRAVVESRVPGRVRFRLPREGRREEVVGRVESTLRELNGVVDVTANAETGSILVRHDPGVLSDSLLVRYARDVHIISDIAGGTADADADQWPETSQLGQSVMREIRQIDQFVSRVSGGKIDGKMAVVILLLGGSTVRALFDKRAVPTPWHALLWYAYSVFLHWHKTAKSHTP
jgi:hypothetical protein